MPRRRTEAHAVLRVARRAATMTEFSDCLGPADALLGRLRAAGLRLAAAESCTGGLVAAALTAIPGSSDVFERGFVTYSNAAKAEMLSVPSELIDREGAVSEAVARAMALGALAASAADLAVAITGVAGPGGGTAAKPVGLVHVAAACGARGGVGERGPATTPIVIHREHRFNAQDRGEIRLLSTLAAFSVAHAVIDEARD